MAKKRKAKQSAEIEPNKPNVEFDDPAAKPSAEELASGPGERAILGQQGTAGFWRLVLAMALFILIFGTVFYFLQQ